MHTSQYYYKQTEGISHTNKLVEKARENGYTITALYQKDPYKNELWYAGPLSHIDNFIYSLWGKHQISGTSYNREFQLVGGYLTSCLGRALEGLFLNSRGLNLSIDLPSRAIFTGHLIVDGRLEPKSAYLESIADDTIQGVSLERVFEKLTQDEIKEYVLEFKKISLSQINRNLLFYHKGELILKIKSEHSNEKGYSKIHFL